MVQGPAGAHVLLTMPCKSLAVSCIVCCACSVKGRIHSRLWLRRKILLTLPPLKVHEDCMLCAACLPCTIPCSRWHAAHNP